MSRHKHLVVRGVWANDTFSTQEFKELDNLFLGPNSHFKKKTTFLNRNYYCPIIKFSQSPLSNQQASQAIYKTTLNSPKLKEVITKQNQAKAERADCGIICCLGLHYIIRCAFRRSSRFMISEPISSLPAPRRSSDKGIKKKALRMFPVVIYSLEMNLPGLGEECVICLSDFVSGEQLRLLPKCNHGFHVRCIDKWLRQHLTCPKCRHCLVETCQKILGDFSQADSMAATPTESVIVTIAPLEPEGRVNTFRESS